MRPEPLKNHFRGRCCVRVILLVLYAEPVHVVDQILDICQLLVAIGSGGQLGEFQFAAQFEPLHHRLKVNISKAP